MLFIVQCESEWPTLIILATQSNNSYRLTFAKFLGENEVKHNVHIDFLVGHQNNIVDNQSPKDDFKFAEATQ